MPYSITTKDGITIQNIPDDVPPDDQSLKDRVAKIRASMPGYVEPPSPSIGDTLKSAAQTAVGTIEAGANLATSATGGLFGLGAGAAGEAIRQILSGNFGTQQANEMIMQSATRAAAPLIYEPRTTEGQQQLSTAQEFLGTIPLFVPAAGQLAIAGQVSKAAKAPQAAAAIAREAAPTLAATGGEILAKSAVPVAEAVKSITPVAEKTAQVITAPITKTAGAVKSAAGEVSTIGREILQPAKVQEIKQVLKKDPSSIEYVNYKIDNAGRVITDAPAIEAQRQGWRDNVLATIKASSPDDRRKMTGMLNVYEMGQKSAKFAAESRPTDIVGKTLERRVKFLHEQNQDAGQQIGQIVKTQLRGKPINLTDSLQKFSDDLAEIGVTLNTNKRGKLVPDFSNSKIDGDTTGMSIIQRAINRINNAGSEMTAEDAHHIKQLIDEQVDYGSKNLVSPLTKSAENVLKDLRANINQTIGADNAAYAAQNKRYSDTIGALNDLKKSMGSKIDFEAPQLNKAFGTEVRKLLSNYNSRIAMDNSINQVSKVAKNYGLPIKDDIRNQLVFVTELERKFGAFGQNTFRGNIEAATQRTQDLARFATASPTEKGLKILQAGAERLSGINDAAALKSMREVLKGQ